jgi:hypothetical protein
VDGSQADAAEPDGPLVLNEVYQGGVGGSWAEVKNLGALPVTFKYSIGDVGEEGWQVRTTRSGATATQSFATTVIEPNGYAVVGLPALANVDIVVALVKISAGDAAPYFVSETTYPGGAFSGTESWGRSPDGVGPFVWLAAPTKGAPNP